MMVAESALTDIGATVGAWNALVRRARVGRERKAVALVFSSYAAADGTQIHCGVARLAVDCEIGYSTARRYLAWLRNVGLVELVRHGNQRKGLSDEYRLIFGPDLLDHLDVPDPDRYNAMRDEMRDANRSGSARRTRLARQGLRSSEASADTGNEPEPSALANVSAEPADLRSPETPSALAQGEPPPSLYTSPEELTSPNHPGDLRSDLAVAPARELPEDHSDLSMGRGSGSRTTRLRVIEGNPDRPEPTGERSLYPATVTAPAPARPAVGSRRWSSRGMDTIAEAAARRQAAIAAHRAREAAGE